MLAVIGRDPVNSDLGVAIESKYLAAGAVALFARAGVGAIALGGLPNATHGPRGLDLLASGVSPEEVVHLLTQPDKDASRRQAAVMDARGRAYLYSGEEVRRSSPGWTGGIVGQDVAMIGNSLIGEATLTLMRDTFERARGPLWHRLVEALDVGQHMGGDTRPLEQHSAALLVVRKGWGYGGFDDRIVDLRVDDHPHPVEELQRLLGIYLEHFLATDPADLVPLDQELIRQIQMRLAQTGDYRGWITGSYDVATREALERFAGRENLEERLRPDEQIDPKLLERLEVSEMWRLRIAASDEKRRRP
jgi:uncharacterized Ntn-hydrolase superfamily protein